MEGMYTIKEILKEIKSKFDIDDQKGSGIFEGMDSSYIRKLQRALKNAPNEKKGNTKYYSREQVDTLVMTKENLIYFAKSFNKELSEELQRVKSNQYFEDIIDQVSEKSMDELEETGLDLGLFQTIQVNPDRYLSMDELLELGKTGLVEYENLTEDERYQLDSFHLSNQTSKDMIAEYNIMYEKMKNQIMLHAIFNEMGLKLNEDKLKYDVSQVVQSGFIGLPDFEMEKSKYDLLYLDNYYSKDR